MKVLFTTEIYMYTNWIYNTSKIIIKLSTCVIKIENWYFFTTPIIINSKTFVVTKNEFDNYFVF